MKRKIEDINTLGLFFDIHVDGIIFLEEWIMMPPQLRAPIMMRLHKKHSGKF